MMCDNWNELSHLACATVNRGYHAGVRETRGMIECNSEIYNHPYISFFIVHVYMEEDLCRGVVYFTVMFDHPSCFLTFCRSGIPTSCYIFNVFYYLYTCML